MSKVKITQDDETVFYIEAAAQSHEEETLLSKESVGAASISKLEKTLTKSVSGIADVTNAVLNKIKSANNPDEIEVEFGISVSADLKAIIAETSSECSFKVTMKWNKD